VIDGWMDNVDLGGRCVSRARVESCSAMRRLRMRLFFMFTILTNFASVNGSLMLMLNVICHAISADAHIPCTAHGKEWPCLRCATVYGHNLIDFPQTPDSHATENRAASTQARSTCCVHALPFCACSAATSPATALSPATIFKHSRPRSSHSKLTRRLPPGLQSSQYRSWAVLSTQKPLQRARSAILARSGVR
jgi:hypothetical protein